MFSFIHSSGGASNYSCQARSRRRRLRRRRRRLRPQSLNKPHAPNRLFNRRVPACHCCNVGHCKHARVSDDSDLLHARSSIITLEPQRARHFAIPIVNHSLERTGRKPFNIVYGTLRCSSNRLKHPPRDRVCVLCVCVLR